MITITAYHLEQNTFEEGDFVRVSKDAVEAVGIDNAGSEEDPNDGEFEYKQYGFIVDIHTEDFSWVNESGDGSMTVDVEDGETMYVVGLAPLKSGAHPFREEDIEPADRDDVLGDLDVDADPSNVEESAFGGYDGDAEELEDPSDIPTPTRTDMGLSPWPESWRDSSKPARLIALDAWSSMGASFRGCRRHMRDDVSAPNRLCASWKDQLYMTTYWRDGG